MASALTGPGPGPEGDDSSWRRRWFIQVAAHAGGGLVGGLTLGGVLALVVSLADLNVWMRGCLCLALVAIAVALSIPRFAPTRGVGSSWQVPRARRMYRWGHTGTLAIWGSMLGTGVLTVMPHAVVLLLPAVAIAVGSPPLAVLAGGVYGVVRALLAAGASRGSRGDPARALDMFEPLARRLRRLGGFVAPPLGALTVLMVMATWT